MSRQARTESGTGVYHAILRGVNKQQIFECDEDYAHFVRILRRQCGIAVSTRPSQIDEEPNEPAVRHCYIYAWCLMGNHVHLLLKEHDESIGDVMKRISSSYCSGATNATEFQALERPKQKHYLYMVHEQGVGPRTLSRLTGVPYSVVQRATSKANEQKLQTGVVSEDSPLDELYYSYCDDGEFEKYPEY